MKEKYKKKALEIAELVDSKNCAYGNSISKTAKMLEVLYGNSIPKEKYKDLHYIVRIFDKISRLAQGDEMAFNESPWSDICGYALNRLVSETNNFSVKRCPVCNATLIKYLEDQFAYYSCLQCGHYERIY